MTPLRWGVIGARSRIAQRSVLPAIVASPSSTLESVASRSGGDLETFGAPVSHDSYRALLDDDSTEAIYIPLPNSLHAEWTIAAAETGKHVLCEKPLGRTAEEAAAMAVACEEAGVTLMEAYMTPFHPRSEALSSLLSSGRLGNLVWARSSFTFPLPDDHRWRPEMGGGALLDLGIYCLTPLIEAGGSIPSSVHASATTGGAGVDATFAGALGFEDGLAAAFVCSFEAPFQQRFEVIGTQGAARIDERPFTPTPEDRLIHLTRRDGAEETLDCGAGHSYRGMVEHFVSVVRGEAEPRRAPQRSVELLVLEDRLRRAAAGDPGD